MTEAALSRILGAKKAGVRTCVPVLGSGLNLQAARMEGGREDDWAALLARVAGELGFPRRSVDRLPEPHLFRWESMLRLWARVKRVEPFEAEIELQKLACGYLRSLEAGAYGSVIHREFATARFANIVSLNFDRRIALSVPGSRFQCGPNPCPEGSHGETLYRHDLVEYGGGVETRIWYPHGDTKKFSTLKLGVRKYGFYIGTMAEAGSGMGESWRFKRAWNQEVSIPVASSEVIDWTGPFLHGTLVFIGCRLSFDEWPLWAMLRWRAAQAARRRKPAYLLTATAIADLHSSALADLGITLITFPSFDHLWGVVRSAIG